MSTRCIAIQHTTTAAILYPDEARRIFRFAILSGPTMASPLDELMVAEQSEITIVHDFSALMSSEHRRIYSLCQHLLQDRDEAASATQDAFVKAYQALQKEDAAELENPAGWITRIAVNTCLDRLRSRKWRFWRKQPAAEGERSIVGLAPSPAPEAEDLYFAGQIRTRLLVALDRLSVRQRAVFTLRHYDDLSLAEIGVLLDVDVGTVKAHMHRALTKLREELRDMYGVPMKTAAMGGSAEYCPRSVHKPHASV